MFYINRYLKEMSTTAFFNNILNGVNSVFNSDSGNLSGGVLRYNRPNYLQVVRARSYGYDGHRHNKVRVPVRHISRHPPKHRFDVSPNPAQKHQLSTVLEDDFFTSFANVRLNDTPTPSPPKVQSQRMLIDKFRKALSSKSRAKTATFKRSHHRKRRTPVVKSDDDVLASMMKKFVTSAEAKKRYRNKLMKIKKASQTPSRKSKRKPKPVERYTPGR